MKLFVVFISFMAITIASYTYFSLSTVTSSVATRILPAPTIYPATNSNPSPTPTPSPTPPPTPLVMHQSVPFISQAPSGQWSNAIFQDGCEETSLLMASYWVNYRTVPPATNHAETQIGDAARFSKNRFQTSVDTSAADTEIMAKEHFQIDQITRFDNPTQADLISALYDGKIIITPMNGRLLGNPNFTPPGPDRHMVVIIGYDSRTDEFITNDPGTRFGKDYRYPAKRFMASIADYPTGDHLPASDRPTVALFISRPAR